MQHTFESLGVSAEVVAALESRGITAPFQIQELVLPDALAGMDVLAKAPTGSGKTLAFALPIVERTSAEDGRPAALVLVPTRELAVQVAEEIEPLAKSRGLKVAAVYGGVSLGDQAQRAKSAHVIVATPGRLFDLMERRMISLAAVRTLVLDEADRMLDMGFKPQVDRIVRQLNTNRQTMFFSATLNGEVGEVARNYTSNPVRVEGQLPTEHAQGEIEHRFVSVTLDSKTDALLEILNEERGLAIVFCRTKRGADRLAERLTKRGVNAQALHGDMGQAQRERALKRFESGQTTVLVATDVAARGLDVDDITHVINYDPPEEQATYTHRVGRTGRAGRSGTGITLVLPDEQAETGRVARMNGHSETFEQAGMKAGRAKLVYNGSRRGRSGRSKW